MSIKIVSAAESVNLKARYDISVLPDHCRESNLVFLGNAYCRQLVLDVYRKPHSRTPENDICSVYLQWYGLNESGHAQSYTVILVMNDSPERPRQPSGARRYGDYLNWPLSHLLTYRDTYLNASAERANDREAIYIALLTLIALHPKFQTLLPDELRIQVTPPSLGDLIDILDRKIRQQKTTEDPYA